MEGKAVVAEHQGEGKGTSKVDKGKAGKVQWRVVGRQVVVVVAVVRLVVGKGMGKMGKDTAGRSRRDPRVVDRGTRQGRDTEVVRVVAGKGRKAAPRVAGRLPLVVGRVARRIAMRMDRDTARAAPVWEPHPLLATRTGRGTGPEVEFRRMTNMDQRMDTGLEVEPQMDRHALEVVVRHTGQGTEVGARHLQSRMGQGKALPQQLVLGKAGMAYPELRKQKARAPEYLGRGKFRLVDLA